MNIRFICMVLLICIMFSSCNLLSPNHYDNAIINESDIIMPSDNKLENTYKDSNESEEIQSPEVTQKPNSNKASIGFVGDIIIMESQIRNAKTKTGYNFTPCFEPMRDLFNGVDIMCANLEVPLAGKDAVFSLPYDDPSNKDYQSFNAPDELAFDLKNVGIDVLTNANNHCLDRGIEGLYRTIDIIESAGLYHTGTYKNASDRNKMLIINTNGIKVGILAYCAGFNLNDRKLNNKQIDSISQLYDTAFVKSQILQMKSEGAEYIIVVPHCGTELSNVPEERHVNMFKDFVMWGADAVVSSHPHVVQPIKIIEVVRNDGTRINAPIVFSLGNFISNMFPEPKNCGLFIKIDIKRNEENQVIFEDLSYVPVYCIRQSTKNGILHQTLPCYSNTDKIEAYEKLSSQDKTSCDNCRKYVIKICGRKFISDLCK